MAAPPFFPLVGNAIKCRRAQERSIEQRWTIEFTGCGVLHEARQDQIGNEPGKAPRPVRAEYRAPHLIERLWKRCRHHGRPALRTPHL